jgi:uncharacterized protein (TIRG00374 family)
LNKLLKRIVLAMLLGVGIYFGFAVWRGLGQVRAEFNAFAWSAFAIACGLAFANYVLRFLKWEYYLSLLGIRGVPKTESFLIFLSGFVLTVTPGKVGEVFKSLVLFQLHKVPIAKSAPIVVAERVTDLIGVIAMITLGSLAFPGGIVWASVGAALVITLLCLVSFRSLSGALFDFSRRLPWVFGRVARRVVPKVEEAFDQLRELTTPTRLLWPTFLSIAAWSLEGIALWVIVKKGFGIDAALPLTAFSYATATLAGAVVPISPGGLGVTDGLIEQQLVRLGGVPKATATVSMMLVRFATLWFAVLVGFIALGILRALNPALAADPTPEAPPATR